MMVYLPYPALQLTPFVLSDLPNMKCNPMLMSNICFERNRPNKLITGKHRFKNCTEPNKGWK